MIIPYVFVIAEHCQSQCLTTFAKLILFLRVLGDSVLSLAIHVPRWSIAVRLNAMIEVYNCCMLRKSIAVSVRDARALQHL